MKDSEHLEVFLSFLRDASAQAIQAIEDERETDKQTQDILHRLELYMDSYHETARLGKLLRQVRQCRRKAKETYERTKPIEPTGARKTRPLSRAWSACLALCARPRNGSRTGCGRQRRMCWTRKRI